MKLGSLPAIAVLCLTTLHPIPSLAQEDETDLSRYKIVDEGSRLPTMAEFKVMEDEARALHESGDCESLIGVAAEISSTSNKLSNIIQRGLKPFYDADRDERKTIPNQLGSEFQQLVQAEAAANNLRLIRNEFWVHEAICLVENGQQDQGINKLYRALDYVDPTKQQDLWKEAREALWSSIGYK